MKVTAQEIPPEDLDRIADTMAEALAARRVPLSLVDRITETCEAQTEPPPAPKVPWGAASGYLLTALAKGKLAPAAVEGALDEPDVLRGVVADLVASLRAENTATLGHIRRLKARGVTLDPEDERLVALAERLHSGGSDA